MNINVYGNGTISEQNKQSLFSIEKIEPLNIEPLQNFWIETNKKIDNKSWTHRTKWTNLYRSILSSNYFLYKKNKKKTKWEGVQTKVFLR